MEEIACGIVMELAEIIDIDRRVETVNCNV